MKGRYSIPLFAVGIIGIIMAADSPFIGKWKLNPLAHADESDAVAGESRQLLIEMKN